MMKKILLCLTVVILTFVNIETIYAQDKTTTINVVVDGDENSYEYLRYKIYVTENSGEVNLFYEKFFSSISTICINGEEFIYGEGEDIVKPYYDDETNSYISSQSFSNINVVQSIKIVNQDNKDSIVVSYDVSNAATEDDNKVLVAIRVMQDVSISDNDKCNIQVDKSIVTNESQFEYDNLGANWGISSSEDSNIYYYSKPYNGQNPYDQLVFANWGSMYEEYWNYIPDNSKTIDDTAVSYIWKEKEILPGETVNYSIANYIKADTDITGTISIEVINDNHGVTEKDKQQNNSILTGDNIPFFIVTVLLVIASGTFYVLRKGGRKKENENKKKTN